MEHRRIKSYVIRGGRLGEGRKRALTELSGVYGFSFVNREIEVAALFPPGRSFARCVVEIGFGTGEATAVIAADNPDTFFIGIEVFPAGVGSLLKKIHNEGLQNIKVISHDAAEVVSTMLPDSGIDGFHIFFPDPWPKKKHHKRRLLNESFIGLLCEKLKPGGYIYAATDWESYAEQILANCTRVPGLALTDSDVYGYSSPRQWRPRTKFETKGLEKKHVIREIHFTKTK